MVTNSSVVTPLGRGVVQGRYGIRDANVETVSDAVLVRLPLNDTTRPALNKSSCMTPNANESGLWVFAESELG